MQKSLLCGLMALTLVACGDSDGETSDDSSTTSTVTGETSETITTGDGDGDDNTEVSTGDGDGDSATGDGDTATGDGDGDGDSATGDGDSATGDGDGDGDFAMTSTDFMMDGVIPTLHHSSGGNVSPALDWVGAPAGTMSFGIFLHDLDYQPQGFPYHHSAIWNIPSDVNGLPQGVDETAMPANVPGAVQCENWFDGLGYGGPGSNSNTYEFTLYALDVADLSNVDQNSSMGQVKTELEAHAIEWVTLSGQTEGPP